MSCLKFAAFCPDYEKYTNIDIILCRLNRQKFYVLSAYPI